MTSRKSTPSGAVASTRVERVLARFRTVRQSSLRIAEPLEPEDCVVQSMPDVSPTRWHLAHTTWFFETFLLAAACRDYQRVDEAYEYLFNSYYNAVGQQFPRPRRGLLSRPTLRQVLEYREIIDARLERWLHESDTARDERWLEVIELGCQHEQQHQELMLTDIKHVLSCNPLYPVYRPLPESGREPAEPLEWIDFPGGLREIGYDGDGFCFDNERPRHRVYLEDYQLASRPVTNGEYLQFVQEGGYERPEHWLSAGWVWVQQTGRVGPLYWILSDGGWSQFTLSGLRELNLSEPVCHVSYFEADAFARWAGARLPREAEWELAAGELAVGELAVGELAAEGNFVEQDVLHPVRTGMKSATARQEAGLAGPPDGQEAPQAPRGLFGDVWEWTASPYVAYPGYAPPAGALGEYNGKFMCNQFVLRGGSCVTSRTHIRPTYRNFFPPDAQWQFTGIRLAH